MQNTELQTKKILGLDVGTNSIGAALIEIPEKIDDYGKTGKILWTGTYIIPENADLIKNFEQGKKTDTPAAERRKKRAARRLKHRYLIRRERLSKLFQTLGWIPHNFPLLMSKKQLKQFFNSEQCHFKIRDYLPVSNETIKEFYKDFGYTDEKIQLVLQTYYSNKKKENIKLLPEDWLVYFLRKKALYQKITIPELVRILYLFNQRRGFKSNRKAINENESKDNKGTILSYNEFLELKEKIEKNEITQEELASLGTIKTKFITISKVKSVNQISEKKQNSDIATFKIEIEDERVHPWEIKLKSEPKWIGKEYHFIVEQILSKDGRIEQKTNPKNVTQDDWDLMRSTLDNQIKESQLHVGEFFYEKLCSEFKKGKIYKIRGNVINRERYIQELEAIWNKQLEIRKAEGTEHELLNSDKLPQIIQSLYPHNQEKQSQLRNKDLFYIFCHDIIYYQRGLKSQKSLIAECRYERRTGIKKNEQGVWVETGIYGLKCAPTSSPYFQEYRIWQTIHNLKLKDKKTQINLPEDNPLQKAFQSIDFKEKLFELFDSKNEISEKNILNLFYVNFKDLFPQNKENEKYKIEENYSINLFKDSKDRQTNDETKLPGNETKYYFNKIFISLGWKEGEKLLNDKKSLEKLWFIAYSIDNEKGVLTALQNAFGNQIPKEIQEAISKAPAFKNKYASLSAMAIKKLLTLMRVGKFACPQDWDNILVSLNNPNKKMKLSERIQQILNDCYSSQNSNSSDKEYVTRIFKFLQVKNIQFIENFQGLPVWVASYIIYDRHSEDENAETYSIEQIRSLKPYQIIKQSKLVGNPLVKKVVLEAVKLVRDVCLQFGQPDEIHIELSRELKKNTKEKQSYIEATKENEKEKLLAKRILEELILGKFEHYDENGNKISESFTIKPNPNSPYDIELFRIYKSCAKKNQSKDDSKNFNELYKELVGNSYDKSDVQKFILWLSQRCVSPYTGKTISLSKLFDPTYYEKEHVIPRSMYFDNSMNNLVICETPINKAKGNRLAANFIKEAKGKVIWKDREYEVLTYEAYKKFCEEIFSRRKLKNLLATEVPKDFVQRQINNTGYIGRKLGILLKPFAKNPNGMVFTIGSITTNLKNAWGLQNIWNELLLPRFERIEKNLGLENQIIQKNQGKISFNLSIITKENEEIETKRLDHRHHALDALIIATTTREHIRYLNTLNAADETNKAEIEKIKRSLIKVVDNSKQDDSKFILPWQTFVKDAKEFLEQTIPTFKKSIPPITIPRNKYFKYVQDSNGRWMKKQVDQTPNPNWKAVRRELFNQNPLGIIWIKEIREVKVEQAVQVQIERQLKENTSKRNIAPYIYDQEMRSILKVLVQNGLNLSGLELSNIEELKNFILNKILKIYKSKKGYLLHTYFHNGDIVYNNKVTEKIKIAEFVTYKVKRIPLDKDFNKENINDIPYSTKSWLAKKLLLHLEKFKSPSEAFKEGLDDSGLKVRTLRVIHGKLEDELNLLGHKQYFSTGKGGNAYLLIKEDFDTKQRKFEVYSVLKVLKENLTPDKLLQEEANIKKILLSQNDLVYFPTEEEWQKIKNHEANPIDWNNKKHILKRILILRKINTNKRIFFFPITIAARIEKHEEEYFELASMSKDLLSSENKENIKNYCIKIELDRLGNVIKAYYDKKNAFN